MAGDARRSQLADERAEWPARPSVSESPALGVNGANFVKIAPSWLSREGGDARRDQPRNRGLPGEKPGSIEISSPMKSRSSRPKMFLPSDVMDTAEAYGTSAVPKTQPRGAVAQRKTLNGTGGGLGARKSSASDFRSPKVSRASAPSSPGGFDQRSDGAPRTPGRMSGGGTTQRMSGTSTLARTSTIPEPTPAQIREMLPGEYEIKTSSDIIEYYVRNGLGAPIKVFYCVASPVTNMTYTPYDLIVVPKEFVEHKGIDHYTVTSSGVTFVSPNGGGGEFIPLGDWMGDTSVFALMRQMRFFKDYIIAKAFKFWRGNVRYKMYALVRAKIERKLPRARKKFVPALAEIGKLCDELRETQCTAINPLVTHTLDDFTKNQEQQLQNQAVPNMEQIQEKAQRVFERVCRDVARESQEVSDELAASSGIDSFVSKTKSMVALKRERHERRKAHTRVTEERKMLPSLVRLADYMLTEAFVQMANSNLQKLLDVVEKPDPKSKGAFATSVAFEKDVTTFEPNERVVLSTINETVLDGVVRAVGAAPRVAFARSFAPLFEPSPNSSPVKRASQVSEGALSGVTSPPRVSENNQSSMSDSVDESGSDMRNGSGTTTRVFEGLGPMAVLLADDYWLSMRARLDAKINSSFSESREYVKTYEDLRAIYQFGLEWNQEEYEKTPKTVATFRADMLVQRGWSQDLDKMKTSNTVGCIFVDGKPLRNELLNTVHGMLESMKALLLVKAREEAIKAGTNFTKRIKSLVARPEDLDGFMQLVEQHQKHTSQKAAYSSEHLTVEDMFNMLLEYEMKIPAADQVRLDDLNEARTGFLESMASASEFIESKKAEMMKVLKVGVAEVEEQLFREQTSLNTGVYMDRVNDPSEVVLSLASVRQNLDQYAHTCDTYKRYQKLFGTAVGAFSSLDLAVKEYEQKYDSWNSLHQFRVDSSQWMSNPCESLELDQITNGVDDAYTAAYKMLKLRRDDQVVMRTREEIEAFRKYVPLLNEVANPALQPRHWEKIFKVFDKGAYDPEAPPTASDLLEWGALDMLEQLETIGAQASKEYSLAQTLKKMTTEWEGQEFRCIPYKDTGTYVLGGSDDAQALLDDQIVKAQGMCASPFVKPFEADAKAWSATLNTLQDMLDNWLKCQQTWLYLEPIFSSEDIVKQMPEEGEKFRQVDNEWRDIMNATKEAPDVITIGRDKERLDRLEECNILLDAIQKGLSAYLEKKRLFFPRFFFLSNDEMLEILSETKDPTRVQPHLKKCFEGVAKLKFEGEDFLITAMISEESEEVPLMQPVVVADANGAVEKWLLQTEAAMFDSIHNVTSEGLLAYTTKPRDQWVLDWPGMVVLVVTAVNWTADVTKAIGEGKNAVKAYEDKCTADLLKVVDLVRGELTSLQRKTLGALVVMDVHARDVVSVLAQNGVSAATDFDWQAQLRSYWEEDPREERELTAIMRIMNAEVEYGYEYLGNSSRLVITPLTDRCYRTLMGAIHLTMGGAPEGPAGTGKTETTKDLAKALARQCVVFNCSDSMDYIQMGKFFKGLASSGAWACFDEFNRIDLEVLSVVAQQVLDIQRAISAKVTSFVFEGTEIGLKYSAWCSITMNPGYAGRSELPDNLKALFRTVAMMVPDYAMIGEIILYSFGYLEARDCATKIVQCYKLCSEQLSSQDHYDYGMRAVMAVLRAAGNLKRRYPEEDEYVLMLRSIIDVNLCKFLSHDVPLFKGIISDLFPGVVLPEADYKLMEIAMHEACVEMNLQPDPYFFLKTIQLYEMIVVRHGLMIVGQPFSGKTMSYRVLARALSLMAERGEEGQVKCEYHVVNPKAITMGQLYGQNDPQTHEWQDGVLAVVYRGCAQDQSPNRKWVILDGPVDAIWIENMNTVLDDNKKLCLNSGEIIAMSSVMNMIFEVADLAVASPATVSRCGMVYLEPHQLGWRPLCVSWLAEFPEHFLKQWRDRILGLFDWLVPVSIRFLRREIKEVAATTEEGTNVAVNLMRTFKSLLVTPLEADPKSITKELKKEMETHIDATFVFALTWSVGGSAGSNEARLIFDNFLRAAYKCRLADGFTGPSGEKYDLPEDIPEGHVEAKTPLPPSERPSIVMSKSSAEGEGTSGEAEGDPEPEPSPKPKKEKSKKKDVEPEPSTEDESSQPMKKSTVYDFRWDMTGKTWIAWEADIDQTPIPRDAAFKSIIVPTVDTVRYMFLADLAIRNKKPILFCGPTGTGKSVYLQGHLLNMDKLEYAPPNFVGFSAKTSANITQYLIDAKLDKRRKGFFGPPVGKQMVIMIDDLNMPQKETYGAQPPIELLRQFFDHGGWYARDNSFRTMQDCLFVAAMGPPGGGRAPITQRYQRHYNLLSINDFDTEALEHIFGNILVWFYDSGGFPVEVSSKKDGIIKATLDVYSTAIEKLLPTPAKSHYTFNLRDVSRVIEGMTLQKASGLETGLGGMGEHFRLWVHETMRVFYDRLVSDEDRSWFLSYLSELTEKHFDLNFNELFVHLDHDGDGSVDAEELRHCMYGDWLQEDEEPDALGGDRLYDELTDMGAVVQRLEEYLVDFNGMSKSPMNLAMFLYAAEHVARICRVLKQPGAHMLCVGVGGSGRQSLSRLASFIMGMPCFQIAISKSYTRVEWKEDLKKFCREAGATGKPCVFLFSDSQIKEESYVEDINNLLNSGEVPNLFPYDERAAVMETCRVAAKKAGVTAPEGGPLEDPTQLWQYFIKTCRANLHVVLCFSPIGEAFRERLRQFPSLVNCCTIDWFREWPDDALEAVAVKTLKDVDVADVEKENLKEMCKSFHSSVRELSEEYLKKEGRHNYVTPTSYLELLTMFTSLLHKQRDFVSSQKRRYEVGLEKLAFTADAVATMQDELTALKPELIKTVAETEDLMAKVQMEKVEVVEPKKAAVDIEVAEAAKKGDEAGAVKKECEDLLAEAIPALNAAVAALDTIKPADIKLVQTFKNPPAAVKLVMEAVCVALDVKPAKVPDPAGTGRKIDDYWGPSKLLLGEKDFVDRLRNYDKDNIEPRIIEKLREKYIADENFTPENAAKAASAAEGLCTWIGAMDSYDRVAKIVEPKKIALAAAEEEYNKIMAALKVKQDELDAIMAALAALEKQLEDSMNEKKRLEDEVELCEVKLERAEKLISGLGGQRDWWTIRAKELGEAYQNLTGDMLISAGMISYLGTFTMAFRDGISTQWVEQCREAGIPSSAKFSLVSCLGDPVAIREWGIAGLPNDSFSIDNGIMIANARRWPLMIDPQGQANKWVKNMEKTNNLQVIKLTDGDYLRTLENAIQFGLPVLLENVKEELDPSLEPLLLKQLFKSGGVMCIKLGDSVIEFSDQFRFYITTSLRNPHYLPETAVKVTLLNFMITPDGLSDQLLGVVVAEERPDLESQRQELVVTSADNKRRLKEIEDRILHTMSSSEGNILDDANAIEVLSEAKIVSDEISEKQKVADETQIEIDAAREGYKPCGAYNAVLFFTIRDLANIDPMYQYSLSWFIGLFIRSIHGSVDKENPAADLSQRLDVINDHFTYSLYQNVCRSLFEKDKLLFSFLLDCRIMSSRDTLPDDEYSFFLTGGVGVAEKSVDQPSSEEWISTKMWRETCRLASVSETFANLPDEISKDPSLWKKVYDSSQPQRETLPGKYGSLFERKQGMEKEMGVTESVENMLHLTPFQLLLLMRCLRPDKVTPAVNDFVEKTMGKKFVEPPPFDLPGSYAESSCATPLLFVLSPGSDPTSALLKFAEDMEKADAISVISMGQGQGPKAAALIAEATDAGKWVLLQNCHLAPSWMPSLEKICEGITVDSADENFRLWLTSMPSPAFPVTILQNGIKMTNEPPRGLRANMRRSFQLEPIANPDFFESCDKPEAFKKLCFGLAFCHAFVQERRGFGPIGWNIPYGFDDGDLRISVRQLHMYVNDNKKTPFEALKYATGECNYGGRVTDDKDRRLLNTLLRKVYQPEALKDGFKLSDSGTYTIPPEGDHESYLEVISQFPILPEPEAFGLHANADITKDLGHTQLLTETLIKTFTSGASSSGGGKEALVAKITNDVLERLPANFDIEAVQRKFPVLYEQSMNTVLAQEMLRYNRLLTIIRQSLQSLQKAIAGLSVMSADLEKIFNSFAIGQVPDLWMSKSFPSLKPLASYVEDLLARLLLFSDWYESGQPSIFWISGFFFTPSFTTAALQNFARVNKYAIDTVDFEMEVMGMEVDDYAEPPDVGIYVHGLFLEGCAWDTNTKLLCESRPKVLFEPAPCIWLKPVLTRDIEQKKTYSCPVYRTAARKGVLATTGHSTNFLMMMRMPTTETEDHWTMRGVCMLCSLSD